MIRSRNAPTVVAASLLLPLALEPAMIKIRDQRTRVALALFLPSVLWSGGSFGSCGTAARGASGSQQVVVGFAQRRAGRRLREAVRSDGGPGSHSWRRVCRRPSVSGRFNHLRGVGGRRDLKLSSFERRLCCVSETTRDCTQFVHHYRRPLSACGQRSITRNRPPPPSARQTLLEQLPQDRSAL